MDINGYRQAHLQILSRSENCTAGHAWVWANLGQCLERVEHTLGFTLGLVAIAVWSSAHICVYDYMRKRTRSASKRNVYMFVAVHWFSDVISLIGAALSQQLISQILFGLLATAVNTACCLHVIFRSTNKPNQKKKRDKHIKKRSLLTLCLFPVAVSIPLISLVKLTSHDHNIRIFKDLNFFKMDKPIVLPLSWLVGYTLGSMGGVLHCCALFIDIFDSYITVDNNRHMTLIYVTAMSAELSYVFSVLSQSHSIGFFCHTLPWTLPRLISAGLDIGIIIQRVIQRRRGKRRTLSQEDADCLLSSESDLDLSSSGSEEVIWMPLKCVESAKPTHPVCASRIQILSESSFLSDSAEWFESRRNSEVTEVSSKPHDIQANQNEPSNRSCDTEEGHSSQSETGSHSVTEDDEVALTTKIATLNTVTSQEKIATWIHTNPEIIQGETKSKLE